MNFVCFSYFILNCSRSLFNCRLASAYTSSFFFSVPFLSRSLNSFTISACFTSISLNVFVKNLIPSPFASCLNRSELSLSVFNLTHVSNNSAFSSAFSLTSIACSKNFCSYPLLNLFTSSLTWNSTVSSTRAFNLANSSSWSSFIFSLSGTEK